MRVPISPHPHQHLSDDDEDENNDCHPSECEVVSHCGCNLHIPGN